MVPIADMFAGKVYCIGDVEFGDWRRICVESGFVNK